MEREEAIASSDGEEFAIMAESDVRGGGLASLMIELELR